jgi:hypothetical protein
MAKIILNNKEYSIDDSVLVSISNELTNHFTNVLNGSGATINLGGTAYSIDSAKLTTATNSFISHLGTITGNGSKVTIGGVEYGVDSSKVAGAVSALGAAFAELESGGGEVLVPSEGLLFESNGDGTCYVLSVGECADTDIVIPEVSPDGDSVTAIGEWAFADCTMTSIHIGNNITLIGERAF